MGGMGHTYSVGEEVGAGVGAVKVVRRLSVKAVRRLSAAVGCGVGYGVGAVKVVRRLSVKVVRRLRAAVALGVVGVVATTVALQLPKDPATSAALSSSLLRTGPFRENGISVYPDAQAVHHRPDCVTQLGGMGHTNAGGAVVVTTADMQLPIAAPAMSGFSVCPDAQTEQNMPDCVTQLSGMGHTNAGGAVVL